MAYLNLLTDIKEQIQYIIVNRESKLNALNRETLAELHDAFTDAFKNPDVGGIIITGAGPKAFIAGADIAEFTGMNAISGRQLALEGHAKVFNLIENGNKPVVAAVNGFALGGGLELAMACHIRVAAQTAKMGLPETTLGLIPGYGGTQRLTALVGKGKAIEMIMTADMITADEAYRLGLVNHVADADALMGKAEEIMHKILLRGPLAVASAISAVNAAAKYGVNGFETEIEEFSRCFGTEDFKEGVDAFLNKRKPAFKGR
jgi:enoyl-CoA hydratase